MFPEPQYARPMWYGIEWGYLQLLGHPEEIGEACASLQILQAPSMGASSTVSVAETQLLAVQCKSQGANVNQPACPWVAPGGSRQYINDAYLWQLVPCGAWKGLCSLATLCQLRCAGSLAEAHL